MSLHSSLARRFQPLGKAVNGRTRADERDAVRAEREAEARRIYRLVDERDGHVCRLCAVPISPTAYRLSRRMEHHHLDYRSRGGENTTANLIRICRRCHELIHVKALLRVSGDADARDRAGRLCGLTVDRFEPETGAWRAVGVA